MRYLLAALTLWFVASASAKPTPSPREKPKPEPAATLILCGPTNWGEFSQVGRQVSISGHRSWTFAGEIRPDGRIQGVWACEGQEGVAYAVYSIQADGSLFGQWGWESGAIILGNGNIVGTVNDERIYRKRRELPPIN